jgi:hypothetical protein
MLNENTQYRFFQFVTQYQHSSGQYRLRVTTQALPWVPINSWDKISSGFDQQATAVLIGRIAIFRSETDHLYDVLKSLDKSLIKFVNLNLKDRCQNLQSIKKMIQIHST